MSELTYKTRDVLSYRTRNILIASGLAVLAVVLTLVYVEHARSGSSSATAAPVQVMVAARDIPVGTAAAKLAGAGWLVTKTFQPSDVPAGAVHNTAAVAGDVVIQPIYKGEQLVSQRFGTTQQEGILSVLHGANRVVQVAGDANQLLAGTLKVGNYVDVVGSLKNPEDTDNHFSGIFLRDLLVVSAPGKTTTADSQTSLELRVTTSQAQRLFWLQKNADWSLLLRPATGAVDKPTAPTNSAGIVESANGN
jgi:Flp pilus assembly protein CpaB